MKGSKLPLYALIAVIALAVIYRIVSPPAPELPGPIGAFPTWKSISTRGKMTAQATNQAGTMWAGAWSEIVGDKEQSAIHIIDFNGFSAKSAEVGIGVRLVTLSWADDKTLRAVTARSADKIEVVYIDGQTGKKNRTKELEIQAGVIIWPAGADNMVAAIFDKSSQTPELAAFSESGKMVGKAVKVNMLRDTPLGSEAGVASDGSSFVFSIPDPAAKDGKSFYLADTTTGTTKKIFDLGELPGRIEGIWPSAAGVLMVCKVKDKLQDLLYDAKSGKLVAQSGAVDMTRWPAAPKSIAFTTYNGGYEFDPATGKTKTLFDTSKKDSPSEKGWRDFLRDSRLYKLKNGNYMTVSETGGVVDIREVKPDGTVVRALLSRM